MSVLEQLLRRLADGAVHSGSQLGAELGISRAAVWKHLQVLRDWGLGIESVPGLGYRLERALRLLDAEAITAHLPDAANRLTRLQVFTHIDSTNTWLVAQPPAEGVSVCLAEQQSAGRGRRGRSWVSPFARNIYCSLRRRFDGGFDSLGGLSLLTGLALAEGLERCGVAGLQLKWPNDLRAGGRKLGGILIELAGESGGPCEAVIGFGINVDMPESAAAGIDQQWTDLKTLLGQLPDRNVVLATLLDVLLRRLDAFERDGFAGCVSEWRERDEFWQQPVRITGAGSTELRGRALGVDEHGALMLECDGQLRRVVAGEVSLRASGG